MRIGRRAWTGRGAQTRRASCRSGPSWVTRSPSSSRRMSADRLVEPVEPLAEAGPEVEPERVVLALEPAAAEAEDEPAAGQVVDRRGELGGQARVAERVGADEQAEPDALGDGRRARTASPSPRAWGRSDRPRRPAGGRRPRANPSRPLGRQARVAKLGPARPVDPERRAEAHRSPPRSGSPIVGR